MIVKLTLEEEDFGPLHDIVYNITDYEYTNDELLLIWNNLPEDIQLEAAKWGMSDTCVREEIHEHLENELKK
jgi:hypothetical protein